MLTIYKCLYCGQVFPTKELLKAHIKHRHRDKIEAILSKMREDRIRNLREQGVDPEEWAAGLVAAMGAQEH
jgi:DNA-directed RNA polymerase subunit RPC12/RpoP